MKGSSPTTLNSNLNLTRSTYLDWPLRSKELAILCVARGKHTIEHIYASTHPFNKLFRFANLRISATSITACMATSGSYFECTRSVDTKQTAFFSSPWPQISRIFHHTSTNRARHKNEVQTEINIKHTSAIMILLQVITIGWTKLHCVSPLI